MISKMVQKKLEDAGINVVMTRTTDKSLAEGAGKAFKKRDMEMRKELIKKIEQNIAIFLRH